MKDYYYYGKKEKKKIFYLSMGQTNITIINEILVDCGSKATLPLTISRYIFKSSAKDSTCRSMETILQGGPHLGS